jgi:hypothetical protein
MEIQKILVPADTDLDLINGNEAVVLSEAIDEEMIPFYMSELQSAWLGLQNTFSEMNEHAGPDLKMRGPKLRVVIFEFEPAEEKIIIALVNARKFDPKFYEEQK